MHIINIVLPLQIQIIKRLIGAIKYFYLLHYMYIIET